MNELAVGTFQCLLGVDTIQTRGIDQREKQIAKLALQRIVILSIDLVLHLANLLLDLSPHVLAALPIEADRGRLLAHAIGLDHRGQTARNTCQQAALALLLAQFEQLPILLYLLRGIGVKIAKDVRVAIDQLIAQSVGHRADIEQTLLVAHLRVECHVQQQVANLLLDIIHIAVGNCVHQLVSLLDRIATQRLEGLLAVPRTFFAQLVEHIQQTTHRFQTFIFHYLYIFDLTDHKVMIFRTASTHLCQKITIFCEKYNIWIGHIEILDKFLSFHAPKTSHITK